MRRLQDAADAGKIGGVLKRIIAKSKAFSLEALYNEEGTITDPDEVARIVTEFFRLWFNSTTEDDIRDESVAEYSAEHNIRGWEKLSEQLGIPWEDAREILEGMTDKPISAEDKKEADALEQYSPSLDEFNEYIGTLDPKSAGGPSGLTYLLVQQWTPNVRKRVHTALASAWKERLKIPGWGRRWLQPIPKIEDPGLGDLRP